jgi:hypothetical protein
MFRLTAFSLINAQPHIAFTEVLLNAHLGSCYISDKLYEIAHL